MTEIIRGIFDQKVGTANAETTKDHTLYGSDPTIRDAIQTGDFKAILSRFSAGPNIPRIELDAYFNEAVELGEERIAGFLAHDIGQTGHHVCKHGIMEAALKEMDLVFDALEIKNPNGYALRLATIEEAIRNDNQTTAEELTQWIDFSQEESHYLLPEMAEKGWYMCVEWAARGLDNVNFDELIQTATNNATEEELQRSIDAEMKAIENYKKVSISREELQLTLTDEQLNKVIEKYGDYIPD